MRSAWIIRLFLSALLFFAASDWGWSLAAYIYSIPFGPVSDWLSHYITVMLALALFSTGLAWLMYHRSLKLMRTEELELTNLNTGLILRNELMKTYLTLGVATLLGLFVSVLLNLSHWIDLSDGFSVLISFPVDFALQFARGYTRFWAVCFLCVLCIFATKGESRREAIAITMVIALYPVLNWNSTLEPIGYLIPMVVLIAAPWLLIKKRDSNDSGPTDVLYSKNLPRKLRIVLYYFFAALVLFWIETSAHAGVSNLLELFTRNYIADLVVDTIGIFPLHAGLLIYLTIILYKPYLIELDSNARTRSLILLACFFGLYVLARSAWHIYDTNSMLQNYPSMPPAKVGDPFTPMSSEEIMRATISEALGQFFYIIPHKLALNLLSVLVFLVPASRRTWPVILLIIMGILSIIPLYELPLYIAAIPGIVILVWVLVLWFRIVANQRSLVANSPSNSPAAPS